MNVMNEILKTVQSKINFMLYKVSITVKMLKKFQDQFNLKVRLDVSETVHPLLLAFSVQSNWQKLTKTIDQDNREQVLVINGIKVFSMMWVLYGHISALWLMVGLFVNESDKVKVSKRTLPFLM